MKISCQLTFSFPSVHFGMENCVGCARRDIVNKVFIIKCILFHYGIIEITEKWKENFLTDSFIKYFTMWA